MKWLTCIFLFCCTNSFSQNVSSKLSAAIKKLEVDSQFRHGIISLYVVETKTGRLVYENNAQIGVAPASSLKVVTAITAFELLGKDYTYKTNLGYDGKIDTGILKGNIYVVGSGDPTLGSWRYASTKENIVLDKFKKAIKAQGINKLQGLVLGDDRSWSTKSTPDGWIWQDMGNYYGAGASALNWRENQYDLLLRSGKQIGDSVKITSTRPNYLPFVHLINELASARKGSGDNAYIYLPEKADVGYVRGTIPVDEDNFPISGAMPDGGRILAATLYLGLNTSRPYPDNSINYYKGKFKWNSAQNIFYTHTSPPLDSINFWFLRKSVNLYGEALVKTIGFEKVKIGSAEEGVKAIKSFWGQRNIDASALKIIDGSGLSPQNRITTSAMVATLQYARDKVWFPSFYHDLEEVNGIKMKSGFISGVRGYAGYVKNKGGEEYTFSFIINNFEGSASSVREKMWKVLDVLK